VAYLSLSIPAPSLLSRAIILSHAKEEQCITRLARAKILLSRPQCICCDLSLCSYSPATRLRSCCQPCHFPSHIISRITTKSLTWPPLETTDTTRAESLEPGEIVEVLTPPQDGQWCKVFVSKATNAEGREYYFSNLETGESSWEEPRAAYWLWDYGTQAYHVSGLQQPTSKEMRK